MGLADPSAQAQPQTAGLPSSSLWGPPSPSPSGSQHITGVCREGDSSPGALRAVGAAARIGVLRLQEEEGAQGRRTVWEERTGGFAGALTSGQGSWTGRPGGPSYLCPRSGRLLVPRPQSPFDPLLGSEPCDLVGGPRSLPAAGAARLSCWAPEAALGCIGDMADTPRDAGLKQAPTPRNEKAPADFGYVGIDSILEQMRRKAMKQGFEFNIMVVGQSGLGKSTLINTLFKSKISRKSVQPTSEERIPKTIEIKSITHDIEEKGVRMKLTVIDTPGFGDHINNENCWQPIMKFINDQYEKYLQEEVNINRKKRIPDTRVHCCLYFIPATGHSLRPLDIEFMKRLSKVVNIVPVIAKADTLTLEERVYFKQRITADLLSNGIDVYPQKEFDEDSEDRLVNEKFREMIPFAVVGSDHEYQVNGKRILGRKTKWGTIEVENTTHCEFAYLRDLLIRTHMQNIKDITSSIHFEAYRVKRLHEGSHAMSNGVEEKGPEAQEM
uniref:Septin-9 isoform X6 n=1 Tax=Callorhinus ursinus TaxID=34884 RepID=A0A3Q7PHF9_CALUR|nr:septin-9 isoform X6 [Callorhinus ursinus]